MSGQIGERVASRNSGADIYFYDVITPPDWRYHSPTSITVVIAY